MAQELTVIVPARSIYAIDFFFIYLLLNGSNRVSSCLLHFFLTTRWSGSPAYFFLKGLENDKENGSYKNPESGSDQHASDGAGTDGVVAVCSGARSQHKGEQSKNEGKGGH